jgi:predicted TIM-barrel fold metal-dependent hydrolase
MDTDTFQIVDAHVHIGRGQISTDPLMSNISAEHILQLMSEASVRCSIIFAPHCPAGYSEANREVAAYVAERPEKFIGFGRVRFRPVGRAPLPFWRRGARKLSRIVNGRFGGFPERYLERLVDPGAADRQQQTLDEVRRCFEQYKFRGIKLHPVQDGVPPAPVFDIIDDCRKPVLFHAGTGIDLRALEEKIIRRYRMPIILAHMGGYAADRRLYLEAIALAQRYPHVYLDTSYVFFQYVLEMALTSCPSKIVFGSDAPGVHPRTSITCLLSLRVADEVKQMVLADNIRRILETSR